MRAPVEDKLEIPRLSSSRRRYAAAGLVVVVLATGVTVYLMTRGPEQSPYRTAPVARTRIVKEVRVTGHLEPIDEIEVPAPIEGQIAEILVRSGDRVEKGQLLARLNRDPAELALHIARAESHVSRARVSEAQAAHQRALESFERTKSLASKDLASESALERAQSKFMQAEAALQAARAERSAALKRATIRQRERDRTDILAPRAGLILEAPQHIGAVVRPEYRLFRISAPLELMHIEAPIGEADIGDIVVAQRAGFEVPAYPGQIFEATVEHLSPDPHIDAGAVFYFVTLSTDNPRRLLLPGMTAQIRIEITQVQDVLAVREAALRFGPEGAPLAEPRSRVWRIREAELEAVKVETGISDGAITEIRPTDPDGLEVGDSVVIGMATTDETDAIRPGLSLRGRK